MEQKDMINKFDRLYSKLTSSGNTKYMHIFGNTMRCMIVDTIERKPEVAKEYLDKLEAIDWCNYLSRKEAVAIVESMEPKGGWDIQEWKKYMESQGMQEEYSPYFNKWALYTAMNMVYSDSSNTIARIMGKSLEEISKEELFTAVYLLALDKLEDKDGMFDIRTYFHV